MDSKQKKKLSEKERERRKNKYYQNRDSILKSRLSYRINFPEKEMLKKAKERAKAKGLIFDLEWDDFRIPEVCPLLGIPLCRGTGRLTDNSPSLDRIIPEEGYTKGNVIVISHRANRIKSNSTLEELELICKNLRKVLNERK